MSRRKWYPFCNGKRQRGNSDPSLSTGLFFKRRACMGNSAADFFRCRSTLYSPEDPTDVCHSLYYVVLYPALLSTSVVFGFWPVLARRAMEGGLDPMTLTVYRCVGASVVFLVVSWFLEGPLRITERGGGDLWPT